LGAVGLPWVGGVWSDGSRMSMSLLLIIIVILLLFGGGGFYAHNAYGPAYGGGIGIVGIILIILVVLLLTGRM
jgi:hypothetical protein